MTIHANTSKVVLVTGATSGIGLGIARRFAREKYDLIINGIAEDGHKLAQTISKDHGVQAFFSDANLLTESGCVSLIEFAHQKFGHIDVLINNAGMQYVSPIETFPTEKWNQILALNLTAVFHTVKYSFARMKERRFGRIINIASVHGKVASEFKSAYVATKHGLIGLTKAIALEGSTHGITCNAICPGYVKTPLVEGQIKDQAKAHGISEEDVINKIMLSKHAIKDFVSVDSIADICLMLSADTGKLITGTSITLDGGWTAQ